MLCPASIIHIIFCWLFSASSSSSCLTGDTNPCNPFHSRTLHYRHLLSPLECKSFLSPENLQALETHRMFILEFRSGREVVFPSVFRKFLVQKNPWIFFFCSACPPSLSTRTFGGILVGLLFVLLLYVCFM